MLTYHETNDLALSLRRQWGIDDYSPIDIFSLVLEKIENLTILWMKMDEDVSGCCSKNDKHKVILINSIHKKGRQNFTLAHELYHLLYDNSNQFFYCSDDNDDVEKEANNFASSLLMPNVALMDYINRRNIKKWSRKDIIKCEQWFQISHENLLYRLLNEGSITEKEFNKFKPHVISYASRYGFDTSLYEPSSEKREYYALGHIIPLVEKIYSKKKISKGLKNEILINNFRSDIAYDIEEDLLF